MKLNIDTPVELNRMNATEPVARQDRRRRWIRHSRSLLGQRGIEQLIYPELGLSGAKARKHQ